MLKINLELFGPVNMYFGLGVEILTAVVLGTVIGLDREKKMKSAGIKTNVLICLGSTLYTAVSHINQMILGGVHDPNRVAAQIVSGIGFLGAGAIIHSKGEIFGLTTAAIIWVVAAVGVVIGSGLPVVAAIFTLTVLIVLRLLDPLYRLMAIHNYYAIEVLSKGSVRTEVSKLLVGDMGSIVQEEETLFDIQKDLRILHLEVYMDTKRLKSFITELDGLFQVERVKYHSIKSKEGTLKVRKIKP